MPFAETQIDLEIITPSEVNRKEKDKNHMISVVMCDPVDRSPPGSLTPDQIRAA